MARVKVVFVCVVAIMITACAPLRKETEVQDVNKPILYCPAPDKVERPELAIHTISQDDSQGVVVKKYKATVKQLLDYSRQLESQLQKYNKTNEAYEELREDFNKQQRQQNGG